MATKPAFDPGQPFDVDNAPPIGKPAFDPNQSFSAAPAQAESKPAFDPSQSWSVPQVISQAGDTASDLWSRASNLITGQSSATPAQPAAVDLPMPGPIDSLMAGIRRSAAESGQSLETIQGKQPTQLPEQQEPETKPWELRDLYEPSRGLSKLAYGIGQSSPTLAAGIAGGAGGSLAGPVGTAIGGASGAALGAAFQAIGPRFASELKRNPQDPDGAWERALQGAATSGLFSGASWAAFPIRFFQGPLKNLAFQAFGIQGGLNVAEQATQNVIEGDDVTKGLKDAYTSGAVTAAIPALGHLALRGRFGEPKTAPTEPTAQDLLALQTEHMKKAVGYRQQANATTSQDEQVRLSNLADQHEAVADYARDRHANQQAQQQHLQKAEQLEAQAQQPGLPQSRVEFLQGQALSERGLAEEAGLKGNIPPPLPPGMTGLKGSTYEKFIQTLAPELRSEAATKGDTAFAKRQILFQQIEDSIRKTGHKYDLKLARISWPDQLRIYDAIQRNQPTPADLLQKHQWLNNARPEWRNQLEQADTMERLAGSEHGYIQDYLPNAYKDVKRATQFFSDDSMVPSLGDNWFTKKRHYEFFQDGLNAGLEPAAKNIQDLINLRLIAGADMRTKLDMLHDLRSMGLATPLSKAPPHVLNPNLIGSPHSWEPVNAPTKERWLLAPDIKDLWENAIHGKGLAGNPNLAGDAYRGWMKLKAGYVPLKLLASAFHPVHVAGINLSHNLARAHQETFQAGQQGWMNRISAYPRAAGQSVFDLFKAFPSGIDTKAKAAKRAWLALEHIQTPAQKAAIKLFADAGISPQLDQGLKDQGRRTIQNALQGDPFLKDLPSASMHYVQKFTSGLLFDQWIPNLKVSALMRDQAALLRRRPDLMQNPTQYRIAMRALGKQIDARFGEMTYSTLFWNRTLKDAAKGAFLSLGWNYGFVNQFGGGAFEPILQRAIGPPNPSRALIREVTNKSSNMWAYAFTSMVAAAVLQYGLTGQWPSELMDYIYPKSGGLNPDGSPKRQSTPFYTREPFMLKKHVEDQDSILGGLGEMISNKMVYQPLLELWNNKDYFGNQIYNPDSPLIQRVVEYAKHLGGDTLNPISVAGARRQLQLAGKPYQSATDIVKQIADRDVALPLSGFGPAPSYVSKSPLENRINYLGREYVYPKGKSYEDAEKVREKSDARTDFMAARQRGDSEGVQKAAQKLAQLGETMGKIQKIQPGIGVHNTFKRLPIDQQKQLLKGMTQEEFKSYYPGSAFAPKKTGKAVSDPEVLALAKHWYSASQ